MMNLIAHQLKLLEMAHPKRRQSSTRRDKRRTHYKAVAPQLAKDATTGELH
jgi:large subunit ribosomal protein L32